MTTLLQDRVGAYAAAVRRALVDLDPQEVEDLTDGLDADLAEELVERGAGAEPDARVLDLAQVFGPPEAYAAELRAAAGLAPAGPAQRPRPLRDAGSAVAGRVRGVGRALVDAVVSAPGGRWLVDSVVALRPLWWVVRAWVWWVVAAHLYTATGSWLPAYPYMPWTAAGWLLLAVLVGVSVAWGRGELHSRRWLRGAGAVGQVGAVVLAGPLLAWAVSSASLGVYGGVTGGTVYQTEYVSEPLVDGVIVDGMYVSNLFVYDAAGAPLTDVQLVDDRGRPVRTVTDGSSSDWSLPGVDDGWTFAPRLDEFGRERWNVYPLLGAPSERWTWLDEEGVRVLDGEPVRPPSPFAAAPSLADVAEADDAEPAPGSAADPADEPAVDPGTTQGDGLAGAALPEVSAPAVEPGTAP